MYLDAFLELADGQSSTVSVASTNVIDTDAFGDAYSGGQAGLFFVIRIDTSFTSVGTDVNCAFQLQSDDTVDFDGSTITLVQSEGYYAVDLLAGSLIILPVPPGAKRWLRGYKVVRNDTAGTNVFSAGAWDMYINKDAPITRKYSTGRNIE